LEGVREANKKGLILGFMLVVVLTIAAVSPVFAAKPTVNDDVWFVAAVLGPATEMGKTWWTGGDTILHIKGRVRDWGVFRSPPESPPGTIMIGSMTTLIESFSFNTKTSKGRLIMKVTIDLTETDLELNPYGVGTLEGTMVFEVTSLAQVAPGPGDAIGFVVATHGTGTFENAKLTADLLMESYAPPTPGKFIFFGTHWNVNGLGTIVYH